MGALAKAFNITVGEAYEHSSRLAEWKGQLHSISTKGMEA